MFGTRFIDIYNDLLVIGMIIYFETKYDFLTNGS